jgi:endonuclease III
MWEDEMNGRNQEDLSPEALSNAIDAAEALGEIDRYMEDGETELEKAVGLCQSHGFMVMRAEKILQMQNLLESYERHIDLAISGLENLAGRDK